MQIYVSPKVRVTSINMRQYKYMIFGNSRNVYGLKFTKQTSYLTSVLKLEIEELGIVNSKLQRTHFRNYPTEHFKKKSLLPPLRKI